MSLEGIVQGGVVVLREGQTLPDGTKVEILVKEEVAPTNGTLQDLLRYSGVVQDLPADMANNHDHYLHGAPKK